MRTRRFLYLAGMIAIAFAIYMTAGRNGMKAQQAAGAGIKANEIGGVVTSSKGPEAGVWVIAETTDLPTKLAKIVVTDDQGRYLIPDLPTANYDVWVRGYGLVDSKKVQTAAGKTVNPHRGNRAET